jgi:hypothetical protein
MEKSSSTDSGGVQEIRVFDYIRNVIDERNALINEYDKNLK